MRNRFLLLLVILGFLQATVQSQGIGDTIHATHYEIHLQNINTNNQTLKGFTSITLTSLVDNLATVLLELKELDVDSILVDNQLASFSHVDEIVRVNLATPINQSDTISVAVYYGGHPFHESWGGFHFSGDYAFNLGVGFESIPHNLGKTWFPCIDDFTDRATYDCFVTVDNTKKAICGGYLADTVDNGDGTQTWHWVLEQPIPTYLASVAVGDYSLYSDEYYGLEDTIPISIYVRPSQIDKVEGSFINLKTILQWYEEKFGPYPFARVGYTGTAIGAMEHAANIAYPNSAINGTTASESLYTHELAHMWFGDMVTCSSAEDMWLNEGWATFCEIYYLEDLYGYDDYITAMRHAHREMLRKTHKVDGGYYALNNIPQEYTYGSHAYDKGGSVTNALRGYLGDSVFFDAVTQYLANNSYQSMSSENMRDFLSDYTGIDMTSFFDAWVMTPGTPHFSIDSTKTTAQKNGFSTDIWVRQKYKGADFLADDNIVDITFITDGFEFITDTIHFSRKTGHSVKITEKEPVAVLMDLFERSNDATTDNYRYFTGPEEYTFPDTYFRLIINQLTDSALVRVTHNWVAPDSLTTPVTGLRLSPYRYWKVEGVFPPSFSAQGRFLYDYSNYLDDGLILSENDSVTLLYRESAGDNWTETPHTRVGNWNIGYLITDELKKGEYTLAVWDITTVGTDEQKAQEDQLIVYPNPSKGKINFRFAKKGNYHIKIFDENGRLIDHFFLNGKTGRWKQKDTNLPDSIFVINVFEGNQLIAIKKLVLTH